MTFKDTDIQGCFELKVDKFSDERGHFLVSFNKDVFSHAKAYFSNFVQDNESLSVYGTIRGLHEQIREYSQSKLVRCVYGKVLDVVVDARKNSPTYNKVLTFELDEPNKMIFIPKGCLHGFSVLSDVAVFSYKVDRPYNKDYEAGIRFDDPTFNIDWRIPKISQIVSEKDRALPYFSQK